MSATETDTRLVSARVPRELAEALEAAVQRPIGLDRPDAHGAARAPGPHGHHEFIVPGRVRERRFNSELGGAPIGAQAPRRKESVSSDAGWYRDVYTPPSSGCRSDSRQRGGAGGKAHQTTASALVVSRSPTKENTGSGVVTRCSGPPSEDGWGRLLLRGRRRARLLTFLRDGGAGGHYRRRRENSYPVSDGRFAFPRAGRRSGVAVVRELPAALPEGERTSSAPSAADGKAGTPCRPSRWTRWPAPCPRTSLGLVSAQSAQESRCGSGGRMVQHRLARPGHPVKLLRSGGFSPAGALEHDETYCCLCFREPSRMGWSHVASQRPVRAERLQDPDAEDGISGRRTYARLSELQDVAIW